MLYIGPKYLVTLGLGPCHSQSSVLINVVFQVEIPLQGPVNKLREEDLATSITEKQSDGHEESIWRTDMKGEDLAVEDLTWYDLKEEDMAEEDLTEEDLTW